MTEAIKTFLLAMTPIGGLRLSIPIALTVYHLDWISVYLISVIGNLTPVVMLLLFLEPVSCWLSRNSRIFRKFFSWLFQRTRSKYDGKIKKYGYPALILFIAIPLPFTGGWTGTLVAFLFGIPFKKAFSSIALGLMMAGGIVVGLTMTGVAIEQYFGLQILLGILIAIVFGWMIYKMIYDKKHKFYD